MLEYVRDGQGRRAVRTLPICPQCGEQIKRLREMKRCPGCGHEQPAGAFAHSAFRGDHLDSACRSCVSRRNKMAGRARRSVAAGNPSSDGVVIGHLLEHRGIAGHFVLAIADAVGIDRWTNEREDLGDLELTHRNEMRFPFRRGDRLLFAMTMGAVGKVYHPRHERVLWEDQSPDLRLDLPELLKKWFPEWPGPAEPFPPDPSWPWTNVEVRCPFAGSHTAQVDIDAVACPRHTADEWWDALRIPST